MLNIDFDSIGMVIFYRAKQGNDMQNQRSHQESLGNVSSPQSPLANPARVVDPKHVVERRVRPAVYVRLSVSKEGGKSKSLKEQTQECVTVCQYMGFDLDPKNIYTEEEGKKGEWWWTGSGQPGPHRPALGKLVAAMQRGEFDVLIVWRSDRLYRDSGVADHLLKLMRKHNVRFVASRHDYNIHTATGFANAAAEAVRNREYSEKLSEDIKRDLAFKVAMGQFTRCPACLGFRSAGKGTGEVVVIPEEIALARRIFRLYVFGEGDNGPMSLRSIAALLVKEGLFLPRLWRTKLGEHREFIRNNDIKHILTRVTYIGKIRHRGSLYDCDRFLLDAADGSGRKETAIPLALWQAAQERLARSTKSDISRQNDDDVAHLLTGLTVCGNCGGKLYVLSPSQQSGREHEQYFLCRRYHGENRCSGVRRMITEPKLEAWVFSELAPLMANEVERLRSCDGRDADAEYLTTLRHSFEEAQRREGVKLRKAIDVMDEVQFAQLAVELRAEREAIQRQIEKIEERLNGTRQPALEVNAEELAAMPRSAQRTILQDAVEWIALCYDGVIVLTRWGTYIAGSIRRGDTKRGENPRANFIEPARLDASLRCLNWLGNPKGFVEGRRRTLGLRAARLSDGEVLPGYEVLMEDAEPFIPRLTLSEEEWSLSGADAVADGFGDEEYMRSSRRLDEPDDSIKMDESTRKGAPLCY